MRKIIFSILGILLIVGAVFGAKELIANKKKPKPIVKKVVKTILTDTVHNRTVPIRIPANGRLVAKERIELYTEVQGVFKGSKHLFKTGQFYKKGASIVSIDASEYYASVQVAKSNLYNSIAAIMPDLRLDFPEIYSKWHSYLQNFKMENKTPKLPEMTTEKENYFITGRGIVSSYYNVKNLEQRLLKYTLKAPFSGILTEALVTEGSLIRSGQKLGEFINPSVYELEISVSKSFVSFLKIGESVALTNLNKTEKYNGVVTRINGSIDADTQTVAVFIEVKNSNLKEGMYLEALVNAANVQNAIEIDRNLLTDTNELFYVVDNELKKMKVHPFYFSDTKVILKDIAEGTVILKQPISGAYSGMLVKTIKNTVE